MASRAKRSPTRGGAKKQAIDPQLLCRQPPIVGRPPAIPPFLVRSGGKYRSIDVEVAQLGRDGRKYVTRDPRWFKVPNDDSAPRRLSKLERRITDSAKGTNTYYDLRQKELVRRLESAGRLDCQQELERLRGLHLKYTPSNRQLEDDYLRVNAGLEYSHWTPPLKKQEGLDRFDAYFYDKNIRVKESTAPALPSCTYEEESELAEDLDTSDESDWGDEERTQRSRTRECLGGGFLREISVKQSKVAQEEERPLPCEYLHVDDQDTYHEEHAFMPGMLQADDFKTQLPEIGNSNLDVPLYQACSAHDWMFNDDLAQLNQEPKMRPMSNHNLGQACQEPVMCSISNQNEEANYKINIFHDLETDNLNYRLVETVGYRRTTYGHCRLINCTLWANHHGDHESETYE